MKLVFFLFFYMDPKVGFRNQNLVLSILEAYAFILGKTWEDKITNEDVFRIIDSCPLNSTLCLRWAGHVKCMPSFRIPCLVLHGVLANDIRCKGIPRLRFRDVIKRDLKDFNIDYSDWLNLSLNRPNWRQALRNGQSHYTNLEKLRAKRSILN